MTEVFGEDWKSLFEKYPCHLYSLNTRKQRFGNIWNMAYQIWLSDQGFIPWGKEYYDGYEVIDGADIETEIHDYTSDTLIESANREKEEIKAKNKALIYRACKVIEKNLRAKHPGKAICFAYAVTRIGDQKHDSYSAIGGETLVWLSAYREWGESPARYPW